MRRQVLIGVPGLMAALVLPGMANAGGDPERGLSIADQWCQTCHIVTQDDPGMDDAEPAPRFSRLTRYPAQRLRGLLAHGHAGMDALSRLSERDVADIVAHLRRLTPEESTPSSP